MYNRAGNINDSVEHLKAFDSHEANEILDTLYIQESYRFNAVYEQILRDDFDLNVLHELIQVHRQHYVNVYNRYFN